MHNGFYVFFYCLLLALYTYSSKFMGLAQVYYPHYICFARVLLAPCFLTM